MKIIICGSMSAHKEMSLARDSLIKMGHNVEMPDLANLGHELDSSGNTKETAHIKIKNDLIRGYYHKINQSEAILVVNPDKRGILGYIGANTFLEIGFAHVLEKKIYVLYQYSKEVPYFDELNAMSPVVLSGKLKRLN